MAQRGFGGEEGWKRDEVLSMMCEAHGLERPGSKKATYSLQKRWHCHLEVIPKLFM